MKNKEVLKNRIGLSHEEAAIYLGISCGQWSMFVSGKRELPTNAMQKLAPLLRYLHDEKPVSVIKQEVDKAELENLQHKLQQDYLNVKIKLYRLNKKISTIENIRTECFAALDTLEFLKKTEETKTFLIDGIRLGAKQRLKQHSLYALTELQLKKESLEVFKSSLEKRLKGF